MISVEFRSKLAIRKSVTINVINVKFQDGSSDCGLFAATMAFDLCIAPSPQNRFKRHAQWQPETCIICTHLLGFDGQEVYAQLKYETNPQTTESVHLA